jgi:hypothetical protein
MLSNNFIINNSNEDSSKINISGAVRGRVRILNNNVVADDGSPLRGEHLLVTSWNANRLRNESVWLELRDKYHLNAVRLLVYQQPVSACNPPYENSENPWNCLSLEKIVPLLDTAVNISENLGMYVIIDYHPVGGYNSDSVKQWWSVIAPRYANRTNVLYEAINEPVGQNYENYDWGSAEQYTDKDILFEEEIYQLIRGYAPHTHIILWSISSPTDNMVSLIDKAPLISYSDASVGFHGYWGNGKIISGVELLREFYPVIMTEMEKDTEFCKSCDGDYNSYVQTLESLNLSWILLASYPKASGQPNYIRNLQITWDKDPTIK